MKKSSVLLVALFAFFGLANAQINPTIKNLYVSATGWASWEPGLEDNVIFFEDFEDETLGIFSTIDADGDDHCWKNSVTMQAQGDGHNGSLRYAYSQSWAPAGGKWGLTPDNYLVSPKVSIEEGYIFSFFACLDWVQYPGEHFGVAVSSTGEDGSFTTIAEWTLTGKGSKDDDQSPWREYVIDLSEYAGQEIYIAIRHFDCSNLYQIDIDDVKLTTGEKANSEVQYYIVKINGEEVGQTENLFMEINTENLVAGETYTVEVAPFGDNGIGEWSSFEWTYTPCDEFGEMTFFSAQPTSYSNVLTWIYPTDADVLGAVVYRNSEMLAVLDASQTSFIDEYIDMDAQCTYCVKVIFDGNKEDGGYQATSCGLCQTIGVGIEENQTETTIYPNPVRNTLNIKAEGISRIVITNTLGQTVYDMPASDDEVSIDMSRFAEGAYIVTISTENGNSVRHINVVK